MRYNGCMKTRFKLALALATATIVLTGCVASAPVAPAPVAPAPVSPPRSKAQQQLELLTTAQVTSYSNPGGIDVLGLRAGAQYPAKNLIEMKFAALPTLIAALTDASPTSVVEPNRRAVGQESRVWKTNELAALLIGRITQHEFTVGQFPNEKSLAYSLNGGAVAPAQFQTLVANWYGRNRGKSLQERKIDDVNDAWFGNRRDAVEWLGQNKVARARPIIAHHLEQILASPKQHSFADWEAANAALALGQLGDKSSLSVVKRAGALLSDRFRKYGVVGSLDLDTLFKAYQGRALLGEKRAALRELQTLRDQGPRPMEPGSRREYQRHLQAAARW